jgi:hypothetical protein
MEDMEAPIKEKKPRTPAQVEAFKRAQDIRNDNAKIKKEHADAIKTEKVLQLIEKQKKTKEIQEKISSYQSEESQSEEEEEPKSKHKPKPKPKPKKKKIVYESSSEEEEEIVYVKRSKSRAKTRPKKKIVYESSSEEEEKPKQSNLQQNVAKSSNDQLKYDLHNERIHSALRSLGYIA